MKADKLNNLRHSCAHLLAAAVLELWPAAKRTIGPAIENGFYYDFDFGSVQISEEDFAKIEKKMREILSGWKKFERIEVSASQAKKEYKGNPYKRGLINEFIKAKQKLTFYKSGNYTDLCKGGHIAEPRKALRHFKLLSVAGAYWRGDSKNKMLTRIYGTCFSTKKELEKYLWQIEEAKKRDHRELGKKAKIFIFSELVGPGLPIWLPKGAIIKDEIEKFVKETETRAGFLRVSTPHIAKEELFKMSGHLPYYRDSMYPSMKLDDGNYYLKAMNCPATHLIFKSEPRSYRDFPLRLAEYGTVYRNELSGTLAGLLRTRMLSMNDAHIYCLPHQIGSEFKAVIEMVLYYFKAFGLKEYWFRLSKWSQQNREKYIDEPKNWELCEAALRRALKTLKVKFVEAKNEAAFYGPKVDVQFKSVTGREETLSTIQLDFAAKKRFNLVYHDKDGKEKNDVFVIHRAPLSTHERFIALLIEHYAGAFPVWLAPVQIQLLSVSEKFNDYAQDVCEELRNLNIRVEIDDSAETLGKKIRNAELEKVPYMIVLGQKEKDGGAWQIRIRGDKRQKSMTKSEFIKIVLDEIKNKQ